MVKVGAAEVCDLIKVVSSPILGSFTFSDQFDVFAAFRFLFFEHSSIHLKEYVSQNKNSFSLLLFSFTLFLPAKKKKKVHFQIILRRKNTGDRQFSAHYVRSVQNLPYVLLTSFIAIMHNGFEI